MTSSNGDIDIILGSNVETGFFYSKAAFAKAGITAPPATWADLMTDLGKLKSAGITPFMFTDGNANCTPSWWERLATTSLLASQVSQFDVNHAQVTNGLDAAVGIKKGIIGMTRVSELCGEGVTAPGVVGDLSGWGLARSYGRKPGGEELAAEPGEHVGGAGLGLGGVPRA